MASESDNIQEKTEQKERTSFPDGNPSASKKAEKKFPKTRKEVQEALQRDTEFARSIRKKRKAEATARALYRRELLQKGLPHRTITLIICCVAILCILLALQQRLVQKSPIGSSVEMKGLYQAALQGNIELITAALAKDPAVSLYLQEETNRSLLHYAVIGNHFGLTKLLIEQQAQVNRQDYMGRTALHYAAELGNIRIGEILINRGAWCRIADRNRMHPLHIAAQQGHTQFCELLLSEASKIYDVADTGMQAIHFAVMGNHLQTVEFLLKRGANPNALNQIGYTPLMFAVIKENVEMVRLLLQYKARPDYPQDTKNPLSIAKEKNLQEILELFHQAMSDSSPSTPTIIQPTEPEVEDNHEL